MTSLGDGSARNLILSRLESIKDLPTIPSSAMRVMQMANDLNADGRQLADTISSDQALTARVLRVVNSSYYGLAVRISSVHQAVLVLGYQTLKSLALGVSLSGIFLGRTERWNPLQLWKHSCAAAVASRLVATKGGLPNAEEAYAAGLLHDSGKTVFMREFAEILVKACDYAEANQVLLEEAEVQICGIHHCEIASFLARHWNLAGPLRYAISSFLQPSEAPEEHRGLATAVHLGDYLATTAGFPSGLPGDRMAVDDGTMSILQMDPKCLSALEVDFHKSMKSVEELIAIWEGGSGSAAQAA